MFKSRTFNILRNLAFIGLGILILVLVFRNVDVNAVFAQILAANFFWILFSRIFTMTAHVLRAARWRMLAKPLGFKVSLKNSFYAVMIGYITNLGIPRLGEFMRAWSLQKTDGVPIVPSLGTVVVERIIDLLMMILLLVTVLLLKHALLYDVFMRDLLLPFVNRITGNITALISVLGVGLALVIGLWILIKKNIISNRIRQVIKDFSEGLATIKKVRNLPLFILYTFAMWSMFVVATYFTFFAFNATTNLGFINAIMVFTFSTLSMLVPVQGGIGAFHYLATMSLLLLGVPKEEGLAFATLAHAVSMIIFILVGSWSYLMVMLKNKKAI